jgi:hypothetical protein
LHIIKTKPIASYRVDIYTEKSLRDWFENEYEPALEFIGICHRDRIYNMDKKRTRIICPAREEIIILIGVKEIYIGVLQNRLSITVVECISADRKAIPLLVIIPGIMIMETRFYEKIIWHKLITVSPNSYNNEGICML